MGFKPANHTVSRKAGDVIDSLNGVYVYENGGVHKTHGRNVTADQYNLGLKYQCVEFVKRYYYLHLHHKMPDSYGDAKDFFNPSLQDGDLNQSRALYQYTNGSKTKPKPNDLLVMSASIFNRYGHVAIISQVTDHQVEVIQQNAGLFSGSRETFTLDNQSGKWFISNSRILGWLRKPTKPSSIKGFQ